MSAITALTAQNTEGVTGILAVEPTFVAEQIDTTVADIAPDAVKTGMLGTRGTVEVVAEAADRYGWRAFVVDPVMVATTGALLLDDDAVAVLRERLVPRATLLTPNAPEAGALLNRRVETATDQETAARSLVAELGAQAVLVKGGDIRGDELVDIFFDGTELHRFRETRIATTSTHGTGCVLASAVTAHLARGLPLVDAVKRARSWVRRGIETAPLLGRGHGPLNLFPEHPLPDGG